MRIGIYTPFKPIIGGGEKYILSIAEILSVSNKVELISPFNYDLRFFSKMFGFKLNSVKSKKFITNTAAYFPRVNKEFDLFFCLTNHLAPPIFALGKKNLLIVQFPFPYPQKNLRDRVLKFLTLPKLSSYSTILCYSNYVKAHINELIHDYKPLLVLHPCIDYTKFKYQALPKKNIILSIGRFFHKDHHKHFLQLVKGFKKIRAEIKDWEYHIAGFVEENNKGFFERLKGEARHLPITLHPNLSFGKLLTLLQESKIFWHATGLQNNEKISPEKSEHFGLSVVEAMASGNVPVVTNKGALPKIVENGKTGYLFNNIEQLIAYTKSIIVDEGRGQSLSSHAIEAAKKYDKAVFKRKLENIISLIA